MVLGAGNCLRLCKALERIFLLTLLENLEENSVGFKILVLSSWFRNALANGFYYFYQYPLMVFMLSIIKYPKYLLTIYLLFDYLNLPCVPEFLNLNTFHDRRELCVLSIWLYFVKIYVNGYSQFR